jgi:hypothetical protein
MGEEVVRVDDACVWARLVVPLGGLAVPFEEVVPCRGPPPLADAAVVEVAVAGPDRVVHLGFAFGSAGVRVVVIRPPLRQH